MASNQQIFYFCNDHQRPSGGHKLMYRHVDILNDYGLNAHIVHGKRGFVLSWLMHST